MFSLFGKKKRKTVKKTVRKPPARLIKMCKKYRIKVTKKVGKKRVYKSVTVLKKQLKKKMKKSKGKKIVRRQFSFGQAAPFNSPTNFGYNQKVQQAPGVLSQSSQVVTPSNNINRPPGFGVDPSDLPIHGVYRPFFTEKVPTMVGPNSIGFMGQPDGSLFPVGGPFSRYTSFGKRRRGKGARRISLFGVSNPTKEQLQAQLKFIVERIIQLQKRENPDDSQAFQTLVQQYGEKVELFNKLYPDDFQNLLAKEKQIQEQINNTKEASGLLKIYMNNEKFKQSKGNLFKKVGGVLVSNPELSKEYQKEQLKQLNNSENSGKKLKVYDGGKKLVVDQKYVIDEKERAKRAENERLRREELRKEELRKEELRREKRITERQELRKKQLRKQKLRKELDNTEAKYNYAKEAGFDLNFFGKKKSFLK
jgi:hypothetical protein